MKYIFRKIKFIIYFSYFNILISVFLGIYFSIVSYNTFPKNINIIFAIITFLVVALLLCLLVYKIGIIVINKENSKHKDYLCINIKNINKDRFVDDLKLEKVDDYIFVYSFKKRMFNTISFYCFDNINDTEIKKAKKICDKYIKYKYPIAKKDDISKPHWVIKGQVIVSNIDNFDNIRTYLDNNKYQLYEIGQIRCFLAIDKSNIIIPFYKNIRLEIIPFRRYIAFLKKINEIFDIDEIEEFNCL